MLRYEPTSRRPIADLFRKTAHTATALCVRWKIHPDTISYASVMFALAAAICFWQAGAHRWLLLIAPGFCYLRLWCNMLDGMVALASGQASLRGEILNDLPDRVSDVVIFVGAAHSGLMNPFVGYWAAILAVLTAYIGLLGQAVGVRREFGGVMSKPWRMVALHVGAWITLACISWNEGVIRFAALTVFEWTCALVIAVCLQTIALRLRRTLSALKTKASKSGNDLSG
ncbi:MAG TPA: CDP-alcohol phosphatidyltransferase family protein [Chthoniobacterales bacterium]|nr:CDP-alcohol phosphatidyltransferase family protein [Chthoniobacterales bacterium]